MNWNSWLALVWLDLRRGERVTVPRELPHPRWSAFTALAFAEPVGQVANWGMPLADGSRVHVHEFSDGRMVAHLDRVNPELGPVHALWHWATESTSGRIATVVLVGYGLLRLLRRR